MSGAIMPLPPVGSSRCGHDRATIGRRRAASVVFAGRAGPGTVRRGGETCERPLIEAEGVELPDDEQTGPDQPGGEGAPEEERPRPGRMRFQDESTTPREPTLAERRAREQAARRKAEEERRRAEEEERSRKKRKRILVGAGVTVGVVALIAVGYAIAQPEEEIQAQCVDESGIVVDDSNCVTPASSGGTYYGGGFYPIFIGSGGRQYHYNYGGTGTIGQPVKGGTTTVPPDGTRVRTSSGKVVSGSSSVSRGGLGVSGGGSSSGS
jgi:hypothetical protein